MSSLLGLSDGNRQHVFLSYSTHPEKTQAAGHPAAFRLGPGLFINDPDFCGRDVDLRKGFDIFRRPVDRLHHFDDDRIRGCFSGDPARTVDHGFDLDAGDRLFWSFDRDHPGTGHAKENEKK